MAGLLPWLKKRVRGVEAQLNPFDAGQTYNTVLQNRPKPRPAPSVNRQLLSFGSRVYDQINPFDAGLTYKQHTPTNNRSVLGQTFHSGLSNTAGNFLVKPFITNPIATTIVEPTRNLTADLTGNLQAKLASDARQRQNLKESLLGFLAEQGKNAGQAGYNLGFKAPVLDLTGRKGEANKARTIGLQEFNRTLPGQATRPLQYGIANAVHASKRKQTGVGLRPNDTGAQKYFADPLVGTLGTYGFVKGAEKKPSPRPLNDIGSVGKNVGKVPTEAEFNKMIPSVPGIKLDASGSKVKLPSRQRATFKYAENPIKVKLSDPKAGEYGVAVADKQRVQYTIANAAARAEYKISKLSAKDRQLFPYARENTRLIVKAENPALMKEAISRYKRMTDTAHAYDTAAGGKTGYIKGYYRHVWDLSKPEDAARFEALAQKKGVTVDPFAYQGVNNQPRVFKTIAEGEKARFKLLNKDPLAEVKDFSSRAGGIVGNQALARAAQIAEARRGPGAVLSKKFEVSPGKYIDLSPEGSRALRGVQNITPSTNRLVKGLRTANLGLRSTILSGGQFHPFNISVLRAGPSIALAGHPIAAAKGIGRTFRPLLPGGRGAVDRVLAKALDDGMIDKAAQIGMPYGEAGYNVSGTYLRSGVGHKLVFERQMPMMHDQVVRSIISDLEKKKVPLDSEAARQAGIAGNSTMGFINKEALNLSPKVRQAMSDFLLAGQFTPSKIVTIGKVAKGGVAGKYARSDVASNAIASAALISGIGYVLKQKGDNIKDVLLRALINPAIPTGNIKDKKGNVQEFRTPSTYTAEIAKLFGLSLRRNDDGHLGVVWKPPTDVKDAPIYDWLRSRLSPLPSSAIKVVTNTNFANKPLYDLNAPAGKKAIQSATVLGQGFLPIGAQGLAYTDAVKNRLPGSAKQVLEADTPGTNPVAKSALGSVGFSIRTDRTKGEAAKTTDYFASRDKFYSSLDQNEKALFDKINPVKKGPFGDKMPGLDSITSASKYLDLLENNSFRDKYQAYQRSQPSHDPLWDLSTDNLRDYMNAQVVSKRNPGGDSATTSALYDRLPRNFFSKRDKYFASLKQQGVSLGNSNTFRKPSMPDNLVKFSDAYHKLPYGTGARSAALRSPTGQAYIAWLDKNRLYNNQERADLGLPPLEDPSSKYSYGDKKRGGKVAFNTTGFKTATKRITPPKGIKVKKLSPPTLRPPKKLSVNKIPSNYLTKKLG